MLVKEDPGSNYNKAQQRTGHVHIPQGMIYFTFLHTGDEDLLLWIVDLIKPCLLMLSLIIVAYINQSWITAGASFTNMV